MGRSEPSPLRRVLGDPMVAVVVLVALVYFVTLLLDRWAPSPVWNAVAWVAVLVGLVVVIVLVVAKIVRSLGRHFRQSGRRG